jgi:hypothetical protein
MTRSRSGFALTGACVFSRLSRCMARGGNHAREQIANANGITASTWPKMPFRKPLSFQHRPYGGNDRKTTFAETECGKLSLANLISLYVLHMTQLSTLVFPSAPFVLFML